MTFTVGHIRNRRATKGGTKSGAAAADPPGLITRAPESFEELDASLREFRALGVDRLVVNGGDGTVREVLSRAPEIWGAAPLAYAIIPSGNSNLIHRKTGGVAAATAGRLATEAGRSFDLPLLKIERAGAPTLRGTIMGVGAYEKVTAYAQTHMRSRHAAQIAAAIVRALFTRSLRTPEPIGLGLDGAVPARAPRTFVALTSLPGPIFAGLEPFWGGGRGALRWLDVGPRPPLLPISILFTATGAPRRWMRGQFRSGLAESATIALDRDFVLDGELFAPGADGRLTVSASETATFLSL